MADAVRRTATLRAFHAHLETMKAQLAGLQCAATNAERQQKDDLGRRTQLFACFQGAVDPALELLNGELRSVIPESAVESTPKAWCVNATKTLEKVERWVRKLAVAQPPGGLPLPLPSLMTLEQKSNLLRWQVAPRNHYDGIPQFDILTDAKQLTQTLLDALDELGADVFRFLPAMEGQAERGTSDKRKANATDDNRIEVVDAGGQRSRPTRKNTGTRRNSEELFKAALRKHHQYDNGSVLNVEPISTREIESLMDCNLSDSTALRLLNKHFGTVEKYQAACLSGAIKTKLTILLGDGLHAFGTFDAAEHDLEDSIDD